MARFAFWASRGSIGLAMSLIASCCLLQYMIRPPLGPRPMFHHLNTEEIRSVLGGPDWHVSHQYVDSHKNSIYIDHPLNLILVVVDKGNEGLVYKSDSVTFLPGTTRQYTVPARKNAILVYKHGVLVAESVLPENGTDMVEDAWWRLYHDSGWAETDINHIFDDLGYDIHAPLPEHESLNPGPP